MIKGNLRKFTEQRTFRSIILVVLLLVIALTAYITQPNNKPTNTRSSSSIGATKQTSSSQSTGTPRNNTSNKTTSSTTAGASTAASKSVNSSGPCNAVLTTDQAKAVIGGNPSTSSSNGDSSQSADITSIACKYTSGSVVASIIENKSNTPTGQHENDDQFGSSRPSGVTTVSGYGQAAYWQTTTGLNVLENNNWYVVSVSNNGALNEPSSKQLAQDSQL